MSNHCKKNLIAEKNDNISTLASYLGVSIMEASMLFLNEKMWDYGISGEIPDNIEGHVLGFADKRIKIGNIADYYSREGSEAWSYKAKKGDYGRNTNKCNVFCGDVLTEAGASPGKPKVINPGWSSLPFIKKKYGYPTAGQWADPNYNIPGWRVLKNGEYPQRGDIAAYSHNYSNASGHVAIVVRPGKTVGANENMVRETRFGFDQNVNKGEKIIFRRYEGHKK